MECFLKRKSQAPNNPKAVKYVFNFRENRLMEKRKKLKMATDAAALAKHNYGVC